MRVFVTITLLAVVACDRPTSNVSTPPSASTKPSPPASSSVDPVATTSASGTAAAASSPSAKGTTITFDADPPGAPPPDFEAVVGDWYIADEAQARGVKVDGSKWGAGTPSVNLADQAKRLYGDRYAEFLDGVKTFAFFPFAVAKADPPSGDFRASVRFYPIAGKIDQAAGIAFAIAPNGTYLGVRANALEDNILYFRVVKGKRTVIDTIRNVSTPTRTWHTLAIEVRGKHLNVELDGQKRFEKNLDEVPKGRIGLWSKADSQVLFDDFTVDAIH
jgi:hypothetical protein